MCGTFCFSRNNKLLSNWTCFLGVAAQLIVLIDMMHPQSTLVEITEATARWYIENVWIMIPKPTIVIRVTANALFSISICINNLLNMYSLTIWLFFLIISQNIPYGQFKVTHYPVIVSPCKRFSVVRQHNVQIIVHILKSRLEHG